MKAKYVAIALSFACALYLLLIGYQAIVLIGTGEPVAVFLGAGLLVLPVVGGWVVIRELRFGRQTEVLALAMQQQSPVSTNPAFAHAKEQAETRPNDWRSWYQLALAYDEAGDRRRARAAMRHAIQLYAAGA